MKYTNLNYAFREDLSTSMEARGLIFFVNISLKFEDLYEECKGFGVWFLWILAIGGSLSGLRFRVDEGEPLLK